MAFQGAQIWSRLVRRVSWSGPHLTSSDEREHRTAMAHAAIYLYVAGGLLALVSLALPGSEDRNMLGMVVVSGGALAVGIVHVLAFSRLPIWGFHMSGASATGLITAGTFLAGEDGSAYPLFFFWVVLYAFFFYGFAGAALQLSLVAGAYALVLTAPSGHGLTVAHAVVSIGTLAMAGAIVLVLKKRLRKVVGGLTASEEKYRLLVEQLPLATYIDNLDDLSSAAYMSPQIETILGYTPAEWISAPDFWVRVLHPDDRERALAEHRRTLAADEPFVCEYRLVARDGRVVWFRDEDVTVRNADGRPVQRQGYMLDITQAKEAEDAVRRSEERFRTLVENVPGAIFRCANDEHWTMEFVSDAIEEITGYPASDFVGNRVRSYASVVHPDFPGGVDEDIQHGRPYEVEYPIIHGDGSLRWVFERGQGIPNEDGTFSLEGVIFDVTERRDAQEKLRAAETRYRTLVEQLPLVTYIRGLNVLESNSYASPQVEDLLGHSVQAWETDPNILARVIHPDDREHVIAECRKLRETGEPMRAEYRMVRPDGRVVWVQDGTVLVHDETGRPTHVQGYLLDVTDRHAAEEEILRAKEYAETLVRTANVMIVGLDREGRIRVFNEAAEQLTGYTQAELEGRNWFEVLCPRDRFPDVWEAFARWDGGGGLPEVFENAILTKDGRKRHISWRNSELVQGGEPVGTISFGIDVTPSKELEEQLRHSQKMEAVGRLAGGIAHDFNNLLTAITGYSDFALQQLDPAAEAAKDIGEVRRAADRASSLTRQLLAFSRRQVLRPEVLDLNGVVTDMETMLGRLIGENIRLTVRLDPALELVRLDRGQIEQVLMNLTLNARDAMPDGGDLMITTKQVEIGDSRVERYVGIDPGSYVMLIVSDTGCGMDADTRSRAFEPFFTTKEAGKGTGLGLATVYGIVKQSGGSIWLDSTRGKGSVLTILLPRAWKSAESANTARLDPGPAAGSETILLVEDEGVVRSLVRKMLEGAGYTILEASDGKQALSLSKEHAGAIELLVTDVIMPGMNGRELAERLWFSRPDMKVLYMSGYTDGRVFNPDMLDAGSAFLHKPFTMAELTRKVREILDAAGAGMAA